MNLVIVENEKLLHMLHMNKIGRESSETNQLGSLNLLLQNWKGLVDYETDLVVTWKDQLQKIHGSLVLFKYFVTSNNTGDDKSQELYRSIMNVGHVAEYLLTTFSVGYCPVRCTSLWIPEFMEHVERIKGTVMEVTEKESNMKEIIRKRLSGHLKQLDVISIVGMPGLGKTTLAKKIYEDSFTINYFDVRAWCCVSPEYSKKDSFLAIVGSITELTNEIRRLSEVDLSIMVHKQLTGRRYFIVLDDIWDINTFMDLKCFFPDDNNGSRDMLTSRSKVIGSQAQVHCDLVEPALLTDEQSWDLLARKVYNKATCPTEFCQIGKEIAEKCKGLPLAVVVVGGVLYNGIRERDFWEQVAGSLSSYLASDSQSEFMGALELSYTFLPNYLKPMFLYLGAFPEDKEIPANKLMQLWMAEGFVQQVESTSLEIQAEKNLMDLIDRSLVMVAKRRWDNRVKTCHVHDLLRDMCLTKAKEEKFMQQVNVHNELPYSVMYRRRLSIPLRGSDEAASRHLVAYKDLPKFSITPPIYTILFFKVGMGDIAPVISSLKLLKVFDAEIYEITLDVLDKDLTMLFHLRYLSFATKLESIPSSISRLRNLEILIIKTYDSIHVPETIWEMTKLRHLHISRYGKFSAEFENSFMLENLQTLSTLSIDARGADKIFGKVPALIKLKCKLEFYQLSQFPDFEFLDKLESLNVSFGIGRQKLTGHQFKLPLRLKKLSIERLRLKWSQISIFQTLPNLEALKLRWDAVDDEFWDMGEDDVFTNLKLLSLGDLVNIKRWSASSVNFPRLEKLVLRSCWSLKEIPSDLGEIDTLQKIEVIDCGSSVVEMVKEIQKEQEDLGNELLKFYFNENFCQPN